MKAFSLIASLLSSSESCEPFVEIFRFLARTSGVRTSHWWLASVVLWIVSTFSAVGGDVLYSVMSAGHARM